MRFSRTAAAPRAGVRDAGHAKDSITITVGYGRKHAGRLGNGLGVNAYELRGSNSLFFGAATMTATGDDYDLAVTQEHWAIEGRNLIRSATLEEFKENPAFVKEMEHGKEGKRISLYADKEYRGQQWGMAIDMNACTGCMACVDCLRRREQHPGRRQGAGEDATAKCTGCASTATSPAIPTRRTFTCSRCPASSARTRPAKWSARWRRRRTARKA